jgi:hypothetical protein
MRVVSVGVAAMIARCPRFSPGDEVDARTPAAEQVERGKRSRGGIGVGVGRVHRRDQADARGHARQEQHRTHRIDTRKQIGVAELQIGARGKPIPEEQIVEACVLAFASDVSEDVCVGCGIAMCAGLTPARGVGAEGAHHGADDKGLSHTAKVGAKPCASNRPEAQRHATQHGDTSG